MTKEQLHNFELKVFDLFKSGKIKSPVHLRSGNEDQLIEIFKNIKKEDYCCLTWASHLECLLKGVPESELLESILDNKSICLSFAEHNIISSAIVGGIAPIAVGLAMGEKRSGSNKHVWCFIGDMTFYSGIVQECLRYSDVHNLPITFVIANNFKSVETPTSELWGDSIKKEANKFPKCVYYEYHNGFPHAGVGEKVIF